VNTIRALVVEGIEETDDVFAARVVFVGVDNLFEKLNFVQSGLGIMGGGADDLESDVFTGSVVPGEPDGRKVTPP